MLCAQAWMPFNESALHIRWPKYWSFSFSIIPSTCPLRRTGESTHVLCKAGVELEASVCFRTCGVSLLVWSWGCWHEAGGLLTASPKLRDAVPTCAEGSGNQITLADVHTARTMSQNHEPEPQWPWDPVADSETLSGSCGSTGPTRVPQASLLIMRSAD